MSYTVLLPFWLVSEAPVLRTPSGDRYWGTKVQRNLPNNNHFTLSSSLFTHDVWSVKLPMLVIIFKMVSPFFPQSVLWQLMQHAWNSSYTAEIKTKITLASSSFYVFMFQIMKSFGKLCLGRWSNLFVFWWQCLMQHCSSMYFRCSQWTALSDNLQNTLKSLDISTLNIHSGFYIL